MIIKPNSYVESLAVIFCFSLFTVYSENGITYYLEDKVAEGEKHYDELTKNVFSYGDCWKNAVSNLHAGCKYLTQEVQSRLALSFANCFLENSGTDVCPCLPNESVSTCLKNSSERVFATYREFFTHTQSICYFLQHKVWQEQTEKTVEKLTVNSEEVSKKIEESSKSQTKILALQQRAVQEQQKLISNGRTLNIELERSRHHAQIVFEEFKETTNEQRILIFEVFDRIKKLQTLVLGEFTGVYTFIYYLIASIVVYILTSTPHTAGARIWLFLLMTANAILERIISISSLDEETMKLLPLEVDGPIYYKIWLCRKLSFGVGFFILLLFSYRYKDYNVINNQLLREIQKQNFDLQCFIKSMGHQTQFTEVPAPRLSEQENCLRAVTKPTNGITLPQKNYDNKQGQKASLVVQVEDSSASQSSQSTLKRAIKNNKPKSRNTKSKLPEIFNEDKSIISLMGSPLSPGRYNLRSRVNSPSQTCDTIQSPETLCCHIQDALKMSFQNKGAFKRKYRKEIF